MKNLIKMLDVKEKILIIFLLSFFCLEAQEIPPVIHYTPKDYKAYNQNWSIDQDDNGKIYVANNKGLLTYNGENWLVYNSPNESIIRSVFYHNDKIYTGCYRDFGYWEENEKGVLNYISLVDELNISLDDDEQFWKILQIDDNLIFQSLHNIYLVNLDTGKVDKISPKDGIDKVFYTGNELYFSKKNQGIYQLINGEPQIISDAKAFKEHLIINIYKHDKRLLVQTDKAGILNLADAQPAFHNNKRLKAFNVYNSIAGKNGFILGTISNGIIFINKNGQIREILNTENALTNNTVLSLYEDQTGNIWAGLDNGINQINFKSPIRTFNDQTGNLGTVYASKKFKGNLYLGTNQGLFYKSDEQEDEKFKLIEGSEGQVWSLFIYDNQLFCGHNEGSFIVDKDQFLNISNDEGTWCFKKVPGKPNLLLQGNYNGISLLKKKQSGWAFSHKINGFNISSKFVEFADDNRLLIDHEYKGVFNVILNDNFKVAEQVKQHKEVKKGLYSSLTYIDNELIYSYRDGLFKYRSDKDIFVKDTLMTRLAYGNSGYSSGKIIPVSNDAFWSFTEDAMRYVSKSNLNSDYKVTVIPISSNKRNAMVGYENIEALKGKSFLFGRSSGYWIIELSKYQKQLSPVELKLNQVTARDFQKRDNRQLPLDQSSVINLSYANNSLDFKVCLIDFQPYISTEYQYKIEGYNDKWSDWNTSNSLSFENLPFGSYKLKVRGRIGKQKSSNTVEYKFNIERPFWLSNKMIVVYAIMLIALIYLYNFLHKRHYKKQKKRIKEENERNLKLQELKSQREVEILKNEKLQQHIDNKNRELAISTMSLIKKNEFLARIKSDLKAIEEDNFRINKVIKTIDKKINNADDWKFFEDAFNNADKDFMKKIKKRHPSLTSNDLRLCAYLRLNLSSKEIAPLFNISVKSVEVKRYRLRKKMNLDHDESLNNYILEL